MLVGGDAQALDQTFQNYDKLLAEVVKRPENTIGLDRLNTGESNLEFFC